MKKALHVAIISVIIVAIAFTALMIFLNYDKNGETNMPFNISKISIISTTDAEDVEDKGNRWNKIVELDNDVYIYIEKNKDYKKTEAIKEIVINNFKIIKAPKVGEIATYRPSTNEKEIFENIEEYKTEEIVFSGDQKTNIQNLKISNQGGQIAFRCANQNLGNFISNEEEINYNDLLKKTNINYEEVESEISFDINIVLENGKKFKSTIQIQMPEENIIKDGKSSKEISGKEFVFKRIEN